MRIENLTRLTSGELINDPKISSVDGFSIKFNEVKNADAFIALNASHDDVLKAIQNGAYAIIYDFDLNIKDDQIAYIKVENLNMSIFRLMRFLSIKNELLFIYVNELQESILHYLNSSKRINDIDENLTSLFLKINNSNYNDIFFSSNLELLEKICSEPKSLKNNENIKPHIESSLFFTSMVFHENFYQNLNFPYIFIKELAGIMEFFNEQNIEIKFSNLKEFEHFRPIFIDRFFNIKPFGLSFRAFIVENNPELFLREANFLKSKFSDVVICSLANQQFDEIDFYFKDFSDLYELKDFRYALVLSDFESIFNYLSKKPMQRGLFD